MADELPIRSPDDGLASSVLGRAIRRAVQEDPSLVDGASTDQLTAWANDSWSYQLDPSGDDVSVRIFVYTAEGAELLTMFTAELIRIVGDDLAP